MGTMKKVGKWPLEDVVSLHSPEEHEYVFGNTQKSLNVAEMQEYDFRYSLMLIEVKGLTLKTNYADFIYNGEDYHKMRVTDPFYDGISAGLGRAYIVVSMPSKPYRASDYGKFVAKIFPFS